MIGRSDDPISHPKLYTNMYVCLAYKFDTWFGTAQTVILGEFLKLTYVINAVAVLIALGFEFALFIPIAQGLNRNT